MTPTEERDRVALIGDLVKSRAATDRSALHRRVIAALEWADARAPGLHPLEVTVGDEFQGLYPTLGAALRAAHLVTLSLTGADAVRFGLGRGQATEVDADRGIQDGSAWWAARDAIEGVEVRARSASRSGLRIGVAYEAGRPVEPAVLAAVGALDAGLARLSEGARSILLSLVTDRRQSVAAESLGISPQAVSQQVITNQLVVIADAMQNLWEAP